MILLCKPVNSISLCSKTTAAAPAAAATGGSWFKIGGWFKKADAAPGPVKANLGNENAFYYDEVQKRWINKKVRSDFSSA